MEKPCIIKVILFYLILYHCIVGATPSPAPRHVRLCIKSIENFFSVYTASSKHWGDWENSRQLCKPITCSTDAVRLRFA